MHKFQCTLQQELNRLKEENEKYKTELLCYKKLKKHYLDLETNILELRRQAHRFTKYEKLSVENIKTMKADINTKSNETKALKNRILAAVKRLSQLKAKFINLVNANKVHSLKAAQYINLQKRLTSSMNLNKVYKVHLQTCKTDFEKQIKEKQQQLHIANAELDSLREINKKKDVTCLALKNKLKFSMEQQKKKIEECNDAVASTREKMMKNNELLTLKHAENIGLKKKIIKLEKELSHLKNKGCDYCGL
nr:serine/threonine-protein kinase MRCK beta-like [Leptinotarsa decemlineata]